jgi:hypothetical protein
MAPLHLHGDKLWLGEGHFFSELIITVIMQLYAAQFPMVDYSQVLMTEQDGNPDRS